MTLNEFQIISQRLQEDRLGKEKDWTKWEKQYMETLPHRTGVGGEEIPTINLNETFRAIYTCTRYTVRGFWNSNRLYRTKAVGKDDIALAEWLDFYITHKVKHIPDIFQTMLFITQQNYTLGSTAGKFTKTGKGEFSLDYVSNFDIWKDTEATKYSDIRYIMHRIPLSKKELLQRVDEGKYDGKAVNEYLEKVADKDKKAEIKDRKDYELHELWRFDDKWNVTTAGAYSNEEIKGDTVTVLRDEKSDLIYGHPFCFGFDIPSLFSPFDGYGEAEILRDLQEGENRLFNLNLDFIQSSIRPPVIVEPDAIADTADLELLMTPESGGVIRVENIGRIKPWLPQNLSPLSFGMISQLGKLADDMSGIPGIIHGEEPAKREPGMTTARRTELAQGTLGFKMLIFGETFLKQLGQKMLMSVLDDPPERELLRLTGITPKTYLQVQTGTPGIKTETQTFGGEDVRVLIATLNRIDKKEIKKFFDIEIRPAFLEEPNEAKADRYLKILQILAQFFQIDPSLKVWVNMRNILRQVLQTQGMEIENALRSPEEAMKLFIQMAQQGGAGGTERQG